MYESPRYGQAPTPGVSVGACPSCPADSITAYYGGGCVGAPAYAGPAVGAEMMLAEMTMAPGAVQFWSQPFQYAQPVPYYPPYFPTYYQQPLVPGYPYSPSFHFQDGPFLDRAPVADMYNSYYPSYESTSFPYAYDYQTANYPYLAQSYS